MLETEASRERWNVRITLMAAVVALCAAVFTGWQGWEAHQARRDAQVQFEKAQVRADRDSAQARTDAQKASQEQTKLADRAAEQAKRSADAAYDQVKVAKYQSDLARKSVETVQNQVRLDQRAWVTVDVGEKTGTFAVVMRNTGKSPALNVTAVTTYASGKRSGPPEIDFSRNSSSPAQLPPNAPKQFVDALKNEGYLRDYPPTGYVIAPGATQISSDYQGKFSQLFALAGERTYVQGRVTYDDVFGGSHETIFCYWFAPPSDFVMCNDHNKMN